MPLGNDRWSDSKENYVHGYYKSIVGTTSTAILGNDYLQPVVVFSLTVAIGNAGATGEVSLIDSSATADTDGTTRIATKIASGAGGEMGRHIAFARGVIFNKGVVVSATTITGNISISYRPRYE